MARRHQWTAAAASIGMFVLAPAIACGQAVTERKWEVEAHGGLAASTTPASGSAAALPAGQSYPLPIGRQSVSVSSWFFGDGASLLNTVNGTLAPTAKLTPLDPVIGSAAASRGSGGAAGVRLTRRFGSRYSAEFSIDYAHTPLTFTQDALDGIEASRSSFVNAFTRLFRTGPSANPAVTATVTMSGRGGSELLTTGVFGVDLVTGGKWIPYAVGGGGVVHTGGDGPSAALVGSYAFPLGTLSAIDETDRVTIHVAAPANSPVAVFGGGVRYAASPRWGFRGDVRFLAGGGTHDVRIDASPSVVTTSPGLFIATATTPSAAFSSAASVASSLSGPQVTNARTFSGSGFAVRTNLTAGVYLRF